jgi:anti-anti-sigma regulatory factor
MLDVRREGAQIEVRGALDAEGGTTLLREVVSADGDVNVDGSGLERIDGAGLTALAIARSECRARGRRFAVTMVAPDAVRGLRARRLFALLFAVPAADSVELSDASGPEDVGPAAPQLRVRVQRRWRRNHKR